MLFDQECDAVRSYYRNNFLFVPKHVRTLWCELELNNIRRKYNKPITDFRTTLEFTLMKETHHA